MSFPPSNPTAIVTETSEVKINEKVDIENIDYIKQRISYYANLYGVSENLMNHIIKKESGYKSKIQSQHPNPTGPNGKEDSWGLVQINLPSHSSVTREKATDIEFSLNFLASNLSKGKCYMWTTCPL